MSTRSIEKLALQKSEKISIEKSWIKTISGWINEISKRNHRTRILWIPICRALEELNCHRGRKCWWHFNREKRDAWKWFVSINWCCSGFERNLCYVINNELQQSRFFLSLLFFHYFHYCLFLYAYQWVHAKFAKCFPLFSRKHWVSPSRSLFYCSNRLKSEKTNTTFRWALLFYFWNYTKAIASHACNSTYAHSDPVSPVYLSH